MEDLVPSYGPEDSIMMSGKPGGECWGTEKVLAQTMYKGIDENGLDEMITSLLANTTGEEVKGEDEKGGLGLFTRQWGGGVGRLRRLAIRYQSSIRDPAALSLCRVVEDPRTALCYLDLTGCEIGGGGCVALCAALAQNETLEVLLLGWNSLGREGGEALADLLYASTPPLHRLDIPNTSLDTRSVVQIYAALRGQTKLTELDMRRPLLFAQSADYAECVSQMLGQNSCLTSLDIGGSRIGDDGAEILATTLLKCRTLKILKVGANGIGLIGGEAFAKLLGSGNCALEELDLSRNDIVDESASVIGHVLAENTTLQVLDLSGNSIANTGLTALGEGLNENYTLLEFRLWGNDFPDAGSAVNTFHKIIEDSSRTVVLDIKTYVVDGKVKAAQSWR